MTQKTLYIFSQPWTIEFHKASVIHEGKEVYGIRLNDTLTIKIDARTPNALQRSSLWHEIRHAPWVSKDHPSDEEECVCVQEMADMSVFYDPRNKWFVRFMFEDLI